MKISLDQLCQHYFEVFSMKDIKKLSDLFSDNIELEDWNIKVKGKEDVIKAYQNIFDSVDDIHAYRVKFHDCGYTMCCEILIRIYGKDHSSLNISGDIEEEIQVMDVITFNSRMKIIKIKAYKI